MPRSSAVRTSTGVARPRLVPCPQFSAATVGRTGCTPMRAMVYGRQDARHLTLYQAKLNRSDPLKITALAPSAPAKWGIEDCDRHGQNVVPTARPSGENR